MTFFDWFALPRSVSGWHSWWSMIITIPLIFGIIVTLPEARQEAKAASRQRTAQGTVTSYQKSDHNQCSYTFVVLGTSYNGRDSSPKDDITVGEPLMVYYDGMNPSFNALEDFSERSGRNQGFAIMCLCGIGIAASVVVYNKRERRAETERKNALKQNSS